VRGSDDLGAEGVRASGRWGGGEALGGKGSCATSAFALGSVKSRPVFVGLKETKGVMRCFSKAFFADGRVREEKGRLLEVELTSSWIF